MTVDSGDIAHNVDDFSNFCTERNIVSSAFMKNELDSTILDTGGSPCHPRI